MGKNVWIVTKWIDPRQVHLSWGCREHRRQWTANLSKWLQPQVRQKPIPPGSRDSKGTDRPPTKSQSLHCKDNGKQRGRKWWQGQWFPGVGDWAWDISLHRPPSLRRVSQSTPAITASASYEPINFSNGAKGILMHKGGKYLGDLSKRISNYLCLVD